MKPQIHHSAIKQRIVPTFVGLTSLGVFVYFCTSSFAGHHWLTGVVKQAPLELGQIAEEELLRSRIHSSEAQWADFNNDGLVDVAICCQSQQPRLYRNLGNGHMAEQSEQVGIVCPQGATSKACFWFDYNNDRFQDLFISYEDGTAHFFHNNGDGTFYNATSDLAKPVLNQYAKDPQISLNGL